MSLTESTMMALGHSAPSFNLLSTDGVNVDLGSFEDYEFLVLSFICNHCPYVVHIAPALSRLAVDYQKRGVGFVAISSNDANEYPADGFENMKQKKKDWGFDFPYLLDESQKTALDYQAACTPDIYVFDQQRALVYRGQFDDTRPQRISSGNYDSGQSPATGDSLKQALDQLLSGMPVAEEQIPSMGCNIKWKVGNEPSYF